MAIDPIAARALTSGATGAAGAADPAAKSAAGSFTDSLKALIDSVESSAGDANQAVNGMVTGNGDVHSAMIALQRAETMLELTVQVRNKLVQAYQDVMRMPI
ncbi:MAG: flagellar hook-basal body complex protein FliE [Acidobacteria bacterium]|nr:flagellar hook-basal body complex protein FliE [Acidobacteriota bacterium]